MVFLLPCELLGGDGHAPGGRFPSAPSIVPSLEMGRASGHFAILPLEVSPRARSLPSPRCWQGTGIAGAAPCH